MDGYDGVMILANAVTKAGSTNSDAVAAALASTDYTGPGGHVVFLSNHNPTVGPGYLTGTIYQITVSGSDYPLQHCLAIKRVQFYRSQSSHWTTLPLKSNSSTYSPLHFFPFFLRVTRVSFTPVWTIPLTYFRNKLRPHNQPTSRRPLADLRSHEQRQHISRRILHAWGLPNLLRRQQPPPPNCRQHRIRFRRCFRYWTGFSLRFDSEENVGVK